MYDTPREKLNAVMMSMDIRLVPRSLCRGWYDTKSGKAILLDNNLSDDLYSMGLCHELCHAIAHRNGSTRFSDPMTSEEEDHAECVVFVATDEVCRDFGLDYRNYAQVYSPTPEQKELGRQVARELRGRIAHLRPPPGRGFPEKSDEARGIIQA